MKIHPTALIDKAARLGPEIEIGPYSIVGPDAAIGNGTVIQSHVVIEGAVQIGANNFIGHGAIIGGTPQDLGFKPETRSRVEIGDRNIIREYCTIHRGTSENSATVVGHDNFLMAGAHLGHNCKIGNRVIIANDCLLAGYVQVGDGAFLGGSSVFHQSIRIGQFALTQGGSAVSKDIPPFVMAAELNVAVGVNVVGLRRAGFAPAERDEIRRAFKLLYRSGLNTKQALETADKMELGEAARGFFDFVREASKRGIVFYRHERRPSGEGEES